MAGSNFKFRSQGNRRRFQTGGHTHGHDHWLDRNMMMNHTHGFVENQDGSMQTTSALWHSEIPQQYVRTSHQSVMGGFVDHNGNHHAVGFLPEHTQASSENPFAGHSYSNSGQEIDGHRHGAGQYRMMRQRGGTARRRGRR